MLKKSITLAGALAILIVSGCATMPQHDPALDIAHAAVDAARRNPQVAVYAPTEFDQATAALHQADELSVQGGNYNYNDAHQLAVLANQRAVAAQDVARVRSEQAALAASRTATDARMQADASQRQANLAQYQASEAQRQADAAQRLAAAPQMPGAYDYRRLPNEQLYEAQVTSVRAVVGPPQQRCWVDRQVVESAPAGVNVAGAVVGGVVGGVLGHQIGNGRGQDWATGIGAVGGAVIGANVGRGAPVTAYTQDVQRCATMPASASPDYWDVTYNFRGFEHRAQTTMAPGATILVNAQGEPRV